MSAYIGNGPSPQSFQNRSSYTATAAQTAFITSGYTVGYIDIYVNGVRLNQSEYTADDGTNVTLTSALAGGENVEIVGFLPADGVIASQGDAKTLVNFNATAAIIIRNSFNVSSVTDNGTGDYTANLTSSYSTEPYIFGMGGGNVTHAASTGQNSSHRIINRDTGTGSVIDTSIVTVISFGDLA